MLINVSDLDLSIKMSKKHKNDLDLKKIFKKIIIIYDNLCAKPNGVTGQKLG
jgi:hypothetical protein